MRIRGSWEITVSVYYALFIRHLTNRLFEKRFAWFWLLAEPVMFIAVMLAIRISIRGLRSDIGGVDFIPWMVIGLTAFFMFRGAMNHAMGAGNANQGLFAYRQIHPIDPVLVRVFTEGLIYIFVILFFAILLALLGYNMTPHHLLMVMGIWVSLWFLGLGIGLILAVATIKVQELRKIVSVMSLPLLILSGAFLPIHYMPYSVQQILLYNPILHGVELIRVGYFENYWTVQGISYNYLFYWAMAFLFVGVFLNYKFDKAIKIQ